MDQVAPAVVVDDLALTAVDPACHYHEQELQRLGEHQVDRNLAPDAIRYPRKGFLNEPPKNDHQIV